ELSSNPPTMQRGGAGCLRCDPPSLRPPPIRRPARYVGDRNPLSELICCLSRYPLLLLPFFVASCPSCTFCASCRFRPSLPDLELPTLCGHLLDRCARGCQALLNVRYRILFVLLVFEGEDARIAQILEGGQEASEWKVALAQLRKLAAALHLLQVHAVG